MSFSFLEFWITGEIITCIVLAAINITAKINNYHYNNFLVEGKNIFITIVMNSVKKKEYFKEIGNMTSMMSLMASSDDRVDIIFCWVIKF